MVGPGEVDEDLEEETGNECTKYGDVTSVVIFEVTEPNYPPEEAVRIFIEFERVEQATKVGVPYCEQLPGHAVHGRFSTVRHAW